MKKELTSILDNINSIDKKGDELESSCREFQSNGGKSRYFENNLKESVKNIKPISVPKSLSPIIRKYQKIKEKIWDSYDSYAIDGVRSFESISDIKNIEKFRDTVEVRFSEEIDDDRNKPNYWNIEFLPDECISKYSFDGKECQNQLTKSIKFVDKLISDKDFLIKTLEIHIERMKLSRDSTD